ncbi:hypothetical protein N7494_006414 [Penicillium frequentans]|uniref:Uncharacterized protein n=1 Tax=Penicillium frequentans TaxID=3151616 RepID=A0AAD6GG07_9EURO|nr:hypothetical protein N7494_006414 [Penicillium glabrum]
MHFSNAAALLAFSTISVYAAPFASPQDELDRRQIAYQVVNVDGDSNGSAVPEVETVTKTATVAGASAAPQTITVTATPSLTPYSSLPSSSAISHLAPPPGGSFMPAKSNGFFRRGLSAAGNPVQFAQNYIPSSSSATPSASPLVARQFGSWVPSAPVPSSPSAVPTPSPSGSLVARQFGSWSPSSVPIQSATPSVSPSAHVYARGYRAAPWGTPSYTPSAFPSFTSSPTPLASLVAPRQFGDWAPSAPVPSPSSAVPTPSGTPVAPTSFPVKRNFESHFTPSSAPTPTPSASFSIPYSSALLY